MTLKDSEIIQIVAEYGPGVQASTPEDDLDLNLYEVVVDLTDAYLQNCVVAKPSFEDALEATLLRIRNNIRARHGLKSEGWD